MPKVKVEFEAEESGVAFIIASVVFGASMMALSGIDGDAPESLVKKSDRALESLIKTGILVEQDGAREELFQVMKVLGAAIDPLKRPVSEQ